jgi:hypothetical protein
LIQQLEVAAEDAEDLIRQNRAIGLLRKRDNEEKKNLSAVDSSKKWTRLSIAVDSGACDSVIDPGQVPSVQLVETKGSLSGEDDFQSATGEPIPNLGELRIPMLTRERTTRGMLFTGAPVAKPLASVKKMCAAGHVVIFDDDGSFIYNKATGEINALREDNGNYMLDVCVPPEYVVNEQSFQRPLP